MGCDTGKLRRTSNVGLYLQVVQMSCLEKRQPAAGLAWLFTAITAGFPDLGAICRHQHFSAVSHRKAVDHMLPL